MKTAIALISLLTIGCGAKPQPADYEMEQAPATRTLTVGECKGDIIKKEFTEPVLAGEVVSIQGSFLWSGNSTGRMTVKFLDLSRSTFKGSYNRPVPAPVDGVVTFQVQVHAPKHPGKYEMQLSSGGAFLAKCAIQVRN